jgi:phosphohistidine phosphatase
MKTLFLVRHAKASPKNLPIEDFDRPLYDRGTTDAMEMGKKMGKEHILPQLMVSSPANRAIATARHIASGIGYPLEEIVKADNIYEASRKDLLNLVKGLPDRFQSVLLAGHNPGFSELCNYLAGTSVSLPTCAVVQIDMAINSWSEAHESCGKIMLFYYPGSGD